MIDSVSCHGKNCCAIVRIVNQLWKSGIHGSGIRFVKIHRSVKMSVQEAFVKVGHACIHTWVMLILLISCKVEKNSKLSVTKCGWEDCPEYVLMSFDDWLSQSQNNNQTA